MKRCVFILAGAYVLIAGCGQSAGNGSANEAAANNVQPVKKPSYCFFQPDEMKGWTASRAANGDILVKGKAHVKDPRYKATFGSPLLDPTKVVISPTIQQNDTGYATSDNWWNLSVDVPNSASLMEVQVQCGGNTVADIKVAPKS